MNDMDKVSKEFERILKLFDGVPENKVELLKPLMQNAACMRVTLEELQKDQGSIRDYNVMVKNYNTLIKHLEEELPEIDGKDKLEEFMDVK